MDLFTFIKFLYYGSISLTILGVFIMAGYVIEGDNIMIMRTSMFVMLGVFNIFLLRRRLK